MIRKRRRDSGRSVQTCADWTTSELMHQETSLNRSQELHKCLAVRIMLFLRL
jgi:hypothetical protein